MEFCVLDGLLQFLAALAALKKELEEARNQGLPEDTFVDAVTEIQAAELEAGREILKNYEGFYGKHLVLGDEDAQKNDAVKGMVYRHYGNLKTIFDFQV